MDIKKDFKDDQNFKNVLDDARQEQLKKLKSDINVIKPKKEETLNILDEAKQEQLKELKEKMNLDTKKDEIKEKRLNQKLRF